MIGQMSLTQRMHEVSDAEARLRHVKDVRARARRAAGTPFLLLAVLGALLTLRGVVLSYWPRVALISIASLLGMAAALMLTRQWIARHQAAAGILRPRRIRGASALAAIAGGLAADVIGANILITGAAASAAVTAWMAGRGAIAAAATAIGVICNVLYLNGTAPWAVLMIYGISLVAIAGAGYREARHAL